MGELAFLQQEPVRIRGGIPVESTLDQTLRHSTTPPSTAYSGYEIPTTYTTVSSYSTFPISSFDSSLPTPVSIAGSPSLSEGTPKTMQPYRHPSASSQQPSPPATTRSDWPYNGVMDHNQRDSPVPLHSAHNELLDMHGLENPHSPGEHKSSHFFAGAYGVSCPESQAEMSPGLVSQSLSFPVPVPMSSIAPSALLRGPMGMNHHDMSLAHHPHMSMLHQQADPRAFGVHSGGMDTLTSQYPPPDAAHPHAAHPQPPIMMTFKETAPRRSSKSSRRTSKASKSPRATGRTKMGSSPPRTARAGSGSNTMSKIFSMDPEDRLRLSDQAKPADKYLFELRCKYDVEKGKSMWDQIAKCYKEKYEAKDRAALQMQLNRAITRYQIWPKREDDILIEAFRDSEKRRYRNILKLMKEKGGCVAWDWTEEHVMGRCLTLGLEELVLDSDLSKKGKRRRKANIPPKALGSTWDSADTYLENRAPRVINDYEMELVMRDFKAEPESPEADSMHNVPDSQYLDDQSSMEGGSRGDTGRSGQVAKQACARLLGERNSSFDAFAASNGSRHPI